MYTGHHYSLVQTLRWSQRGLILPFVYACVVVALHEWYALEFLRIPTLPMSLVGIAVAFYLGFKNNASYARLWEARTIWGSIVNSSRSWAHSVRDLVVGVDQDQDELRVIHRELVLRHIAWLDALRHQLRRLQTWEHGGDDLVALRKSEGVAEYSETLAEVLRTHLSEGETEQALAQINPAAFLLARQSKRLAELRNAKCLDGFSHTLLMGLLQQLMNHQGASERIKNFPFPRQYATVNTFFARLFALLLPFGLIPEFHAMGGGMVWMTVIFSTLVSWVFLTTDQIGEWSENPFEGLANDVPITAMSRAIERDLLQMIGETQLPAPRAMAGKTLY